VLLAGEEIENQGGQLQKINLGAEIFNATQNIENMNTCHE
jgi:hypothetical protein